MRIHCAMLLFILIADLHQCIGQTTGASYTKGLFLTGGFEITGSNDYKFQQQGNVLRPGITWINGEHLRGSGFTFSGALHFRASQHFAFETGFNLTEMDQAVYDQKFQSINPVTVEFQNDYKSVEAFQGNFDVANLYASPYLSFYFFPARQPHDIQFYLNPGIQWNVNTQSPTRFGSWSKTTMSPAQNYLQPGPTVETLALTSNMLPHYFAGFLEGGLFIHDQARRMDRPMTGGFFIGLRYYWAGNTMTGDYAHKVNGRVTYSDHAIATGNYIAFTFRAGMPLLTKDATSSNPKLLRRANRTSQPRRTGHSNQKTPKHTRHRPPLRKQPSRGPRRKKDENSNHENTRGF